MILYDYATCFRKKVFTMFIGRPLISKGSVDQPPTTEQGRTGISWKYAEKIWDVINHHICLQ